jgi:hypothetical protein
MGYKKKPESKSSQERANTILLEKLKKGEEKFYNFQKIHSLSWGFRLQDFNKIKDQDILAFIAKEHFDWNHRAAAVNQLDSHEWQDLLGWMAKNDENYPVRSRAINKLNNQEILGNIAQFSKDHLERVDAIRRLTNQELLEAIAKNSNEFPLNRRDAINRLDSKQILEDLALNDPKEEIRMWAAQKIINQSLLFKIATNEEEKPKVRKAAILKLEPEKYLAFLIQLALNSRVYEVRTSAMDKIKSSKKGQKALAQLAEHDKNHYIRVLAIHKLNKSKWQKLLIKIAQIDNNREVVEEAVRKITDRATLYEFVKNHDSTNIRIPALLNIKNQNLLAEIAKNNSDRRVRERAIPELKSNKWQSLLVEIAKNDDDPWVRKRAVREIKDKKILDQIIKADPDYMVREMALCRVYDEEKIPKVLERLQDQSILMDIAVHSGSETMRLQAFRKIDPKKFKNFLSLVKNSWDAVEFLKSLMSKIPLQDHQLADIIEVVENIEIGRYALGKIQNQDTFESLALNKSIGAIGRYIVYRLERQSFLKKLALKKGEPTVREAAISKLDKNLWQDLFVEMLKTDKSPSIRSIVIKKIKDQQTMAKFAMKDKSTLVRQAAIERITDEGILETIIKKEQNHLVKSEAIQKLKKIRDKNK